jgi:hypothetical protein
MIVLSHFINHQAMKIHGGANVYLHALLTSAQDGAEWSASRRSPIPRENNLRYPLDGRLGGHERLTGW